MLLWAVLCVYMCMLMCLYVYMRVAVAGVAVSAFVSVDVCMLMWCVCVHLMWTNVCIVLRLCVSMIGSLCVFHMC